MPGGNPHDFLGLENWQPLPWGKPVRIFKKMVGSAMRCRCSRRPTLVALRQRHGVQAKPRNLQEVHSPSLCLPNLEVREVRAPSSEEVRSSVAEVAARYTCEGGCSNRQEGRLGPWPKKEAEHPRAPLLEVPLAAEDCADGSSFRPEAAPRPAAPAAARAFVAVELPRCDEAHESKRLHHLVGKLGDLGS